MRTHGWGGTPPSSDDEAIDRIKAATHLCVRTFGSSTTIAHVASELSVSRQTVYRYFASTEALLVSAALDGLQDFLRRLRRRLRPITDPGEALVEALAYTLDRVRTEPYLSLLVADRPQSLVSNITSEMSLAVGRSLLDHTSVDWAARGMTPKDQDEIAEWTLRTLQSFLIEPGNPARSPAELRAFLRRWLAPAVNAKREVTP